MHPISNGSLFHDYPKYVYQVPDARLVDAYRPEPKPFSLNGPEKSDKTKKDLKKNKDPSKKEEKEKKRPFE